MRYYVDTSVLTAYYTPEPLSAEAQRLLRESPSPAVSNLAEVELFSAIARKARRGELGVRSAQRVRREFLSHLEGRYYERLPLETEHFRMARNWLGGDCPPMGTLDALHIAVASVAARTLLTADRQQCHAAEAFQVPTVLLEPA